MPGHLVFLGESLHRVEQFAFDIDRGKAVLGRELLGCESKQLGGHENRHELTVLGGPGELCVELAGFEGGRRELRDGSDGARPAGRRPGGSGGGQGNFGRTDVGR